MLFVRSDRRCCQDTVCSETKFLGTCRWAFCNEISGIRSVGPCGRCLAALLDSLVLKADSGSGSVPYSYRVIRAILCNVTKIGLVEDTVGFAGIITRRTRLRTLYLEPSAQTSADSYFDMYE